METDPASGTLIAGFEGDMNISALVCNAYSHNQQTPTVWGMANVTSGDHMLSLPESLKVDDNSYRNGLNIQHFSSNLDNVVVYCGTQDRPKLAYFRLRLYSKYLTVSCVVI